MKLSMTIFLNYFLEKQIVIKGQFSFREDEHGHLEYDRNPDFSLGGIKAFGP